VQSSVALLSTTLKRWNSDSFQWSRSWLCQSSCSFFV